MPAIIPIIAICTCSSWYDKGNNSSNVIKIIIPPTNASVNDKTTGFRKGNNIKKATIAPIGSATPEKNEYQNAFERLFVA